MGDVLGSFPSSEQARRRRRVLIIGPAPPPMGGMARYAADLLGSDLAVWHDLALFPDNVPQGMRPRVNTEAFTWNVLGRDGLVSSARVAGFVARKMLELRRRIVRQRIDLVHVLSTAGFGFFRNAAHILIARRLGATTVFHLLGQFDDLYRDAGPTLRRLVRWSLDLADAHIVQSPGLAGVLRPLTRKPIYAILNGVRVKELAPLGDYSHGDETGIRVVSIGLVGHRKGTFDLLDLASRLGPARPDIRFVVAGGGEFDRFRKIVGERNLQNVEILGPVDDATRVRLLHTADIFVLPSRAEGQPIALLEAMAAGLPVISTTVGSIPEVVGPDNGILIPPGDLTALQDAITRLAGDSALRARMGCANRIEAHRRFDLRRVFEEIDAVYQAV